MDQAVKAIDYDAFDPALWIKAINNIKKPDWGKVQEVFDGNEK